MRAEEDEGLVVVVGTADRTRPVVPAAEDAEVDAPGAAPSLPCAAAKTVLLKLPDMPLSAKRAEKAMGGTPELFILVPSIRIK